MPPDREGGGSVRGRADLIQRLKQLPPGGRCFDGEQHDAVRLLLRVRAPAASVTQRVAVAAGGPVLRQGPIKGPEVTTSTLRRRSPLAQPQRAITATMLWLSTMRRVLHFPAALALLTLIAASACATTGAPVAPTERSFRVMTWNVNYGLLPDAGAIALLQNADVDVVLLQETTPAWHRALKRELRGTFTYQRHHVHDAAGGLSVLSRYPIKADELIANAISWFPAQRTVIATPSGRVQTLNVHLRPPFDDDGNIVTGYFTTKSIRGDEVDNFTGFLDPDLPAIVAGDFNEADGQAVARLEANGFDGALQRFDGSATTWRWPLPVAGEITGTLDHVFVDARLQTVDAWVLYDGESDHFPVVAWVQPPTRVRAAEGLGRRTRVPDIASGYGLGSD
jgi:endonuclease/exonuclease/phosphatase (EEP) superfamily protein YafD